MIILGRSSSPKNSFDIRVFKLLQELYQKQKIYFSSESDYYKDEDYFVSKTQLIPNDGQYIANSSLLRWVVFSVFDLISYNKDTTRFDLKFVKINKKFSCVGIDFLDCLKKIDLHRIVRHCIAEMVYFEARNIVLNLELGEFKGKVSQEGMDSYICKDAVIKAYGSYTAETLYEFCTFIRNSNLRITDEIEKRYLPKDTPIESEIVNALLSGKIYPVCHTTKTISGKNHNFKGFIPCFMINNETQEMYANKRPVSKKGRQLLTDLSTDNTLLSHSYSKPLLRRSKGITFEPETYTGKTFIFEVK